MSDSLRQLLVAREDMYSHFQDSKACDDYFIVDENHQDEYAAYYTSMYLIQDSAESLIHHRDAGFSDDPLKGYIEFWGVMQALVIQQDALRELHSVIIGEDDWPLETEPWKELRNLRNQCAGHPARQGHKERPAKRVFMGRNFGSYDSVKFEKWDDESKKVSYVEFDLGGLIDRYGEDATRLLEEMLEHMKGRWP